MTPAEQAYWQAGRERPMRQSEIDRFVATGVPAQALVVPDMLLPARVVFHDEANRFSFADETRDASELTGAFILPVRDEAGDVADIVAWQPASGRTATWQACAWALGQGEFPAPLHVLHDDGAAHVFRNVMDWLRADRRGLVILDYGLARWRFAEAAVPLIADDLAHARDLKHALAIKPVPILLPRIAELRRAA